jgi:hypothetical protein
MTERRCAAARSTRACHSSALHSPRAAGEFINCIDLLLEERIEPVDLGRRLPRLVGLAELRQRGGAHCLEKALVGRAAQRGVRRLHRFAVAALEVVAERQVEARLARDARVEPRIHHFRLTVTDVNDAPTLSGANNFTGITDETPAVGVEDAFGKNLERLGKIKAKYDPDNFFRLNNNITPAS